MYFNGLLIDIIITSQDDIATWAFYLIEKYKTLLSTNILHGYLNFFICIKTDTDNKLGFSQEKNLDISQKKLNIIEYCI